MLIYQGDQFTARYAQVSGGPCNGSTFLDFSIYKAFPLNGCTSINGYTTAICLYRYLTITGTCNSTCQVYALGKMGEILETYNPGVNNNGPGKLLY